MASHSFFSPPFHLISSHLIAFHPHLISPHRSLRNLNVITPPHPSSNWSAKRFGVPVCAQEHERYHPASPYPIPRKVPVSAGGKRGDKVCCVCVCTGTWTLLAHPTPSPDSSMCTDEPDMCVQMNPKCVYRWTGSVCTDDPDLCAQMTLHPEKGGEGVSYIDFDAHGVVLGNLTK